MTALSWTITLLCVALCHLAPPTPASHLVLEVLAGQNVTLTCNLTSSVDVTWWVVRNGTQLLSLVTAAVNKFGRSTVILHTQDSRFTAQRAGAETAVALEVQQFQEEDTGLYFCTGRCQDSVCSNRARLLTIRGADGMSLTEGNCRPCWDFVLFPASLIFITILLIIIIVFIVNSGESWSCACGSLDRQSALDRSEGDQLHYSSLRHQALPRPHVLVKEEVTYATVHRLSDHSGSHDAA